MIANSIQCYIQLTFDCIEGISRPYQRRKLRMERPRRTGSLQRWSWIDFSSGSSLLLLLVREILQKRFIRQRNNANNSLSSGKQELTFKLEIFISLIRKLLTLIRKCEDKSLLLQFLTLISAWPDTANLAQINKNKYVCASITELSLKTLLFICAKLCNILCTVIIYLKYLFFTLLQYYVCCFFLFRYY